MFLDGVVYPTVENAYQAAKALRGNRIVFETITPGNAWRLGRGLKLPADWDCRKIEIMRGLLAKKFAEGSELAGWLLSTGDAPLAEGNTWGDTFWGVCNGEGENHLGRLLMRRRRRLRDLLSAPWPTVNVAHQRRSPG